MFYILPSLYHMPHTEKSDTFIWYWYCRNGVFVFVLFATLLSILFTSFEEEVIICAVKGP